MSSGRLVLTDAHFTHLRSLLSELAGLVFDDTRRESMAFCIAERLRDTTAPDVASYLELLHDPQERQALLDEVTIQETHFFRNPPQMRALRAQVIPELLAHAATHGRRLRIWSAGCSTGEEAYSIAMLLRELMPTTAGWDVKIVATDVSERALEQARQGRYGGRAVQMASPTDLARFFQPVRGGFEVRPEVRELVEFRHHNLVTEPPPFEPAERVDLVLCRNVTIYFSRDTTRALMQRLHRVLRDGGYLFLGHSETLWQVSQDFRLVALGSGQDAAFVYRRLDRPDLPADAALAPPALERRSILVDRRTLSTGPPEGRDQLRVQARRTPSPPPKEQAPVELTDSASAAAADVTPPRVRRALREGRYDDAVRLAGLLIDDLPLEAEAFYLRGLALVSGGEDAAALVDLRKAVYLDPGSGLAHFLLAGALARTGAAAAAAREFAAAADALTTRPPSADTDELGGRSVQELAALCRQLSRPVQEPA